MNVLANATLSLIVAPAVSDGRGTMTPGASSVVAVRGTMGEPTFSQKTGLAEKIALATATFVIFKSDAPSGFAVSEASRLTITIDGSTSRKYEVVYVRDQQKEGGLAHFELFLKGV